MLDRDFVEPAPATPDQADDILYEIGLRIFDNRVILLELGHDGFGGSVESDEIPEAIRDHFPDPDYSAIDRVRYGLSATWWYSSDKEDPLRLPDQVAHIHLTQSEHAEDEDTGPISHIDYAILKDGDSLRIERAVRTNMRRTEEQLMQLIRGEPGSDDFLKRPRASDKDRTLERSLGISTVTSDEAVQLLELLQHLRAEKHAEIQRQALPRFVRFLSWLYK